MLLREVTSTALLYVGSMPSAIMFLQEWSSITKLNQHLVINLPSTLPSCFAMSLFLFQFSIPVVSSAGSDCSDSSAGSYGLLVLVAYEANYHMTCVPALTGFLRTFIFANFANFC